MELPLGTTVVIPHYAFPIVGVILCALLVFAFGFKSPSQPPSFGSIDDEHDKKSKKRKAKESQKNKAQANGHAPTSSPKIVSQAKQKVEKVEKAAAPVKQKLDKTDAKTTQQKKPAQEKEKRPAATRGKKDAAKQPEEHTPAPQTAEDTDEGWVQLLSKKEKKIRRKEEEKTSVSADKSQAKATATEESKSPAAKRKKQPKEAEAKKAEPEAKAPQELVTTEPIVAADPEEHPKDQRNKRKTSRLQNQSQ
uniref:Uncharacterized protein n=1 Tax=Amblyomma maculatum TaxID=34609 RepID=G3MF21_AMBMU